MHTVGHIDFGIYRCIAEDITTDEVIITSERIQHIENRRGPDFIEKYERYFPLVLADPDFIFKDDRPSTAIVCKSFADKDESINIVLRLAVKGDPQGYKNSILTAIKENKKRFSQRLRNNSPLYKKI